MSLRPADPTGPEDAAGPSRGLRIALVTVNYAPEVTGIAAYTTSLAEGLADAGHHIDVVTAAPHYPAWKVFPTSEWAPRERRGTLSITRLRSYVPSKPSLLKRSLFELLYGLRFAARPMRGADAVILVSPALFTSLVVQTRLRARGTRIPVILWVQDRYSAGVNELGGRLARMASGIIRSLESRLARNSDRVVVIHDRWIGDVEQILKVTKDRIRSVRNWTHVDMPPEVDVAAVRAGLGWGVADTETVVLHSGNMGVKQGLENVVEAARLAEKRGSAVRFVLMGDGSQRAGLEAAGQGCAALQFLPPMSADGFARTLMAADVLLVNELPGLKETAVPSKLTSYFASGRPVIAATDPASVTAAEIGLSGAGVVIEPGNPEALIAAAESHDTSVGQTRGEAGRRFVREVLSMEAGIRAFENVLFEASSGSEVQKTR